jgi:glycosyltransferase involved in cell wall biosynthesis
MSHHTNPMPPGDCLLFATADWDTPYWTNKQHTAHHLALAGWRVLYVESVGLRQPRMGSGTDWGRLLKRLWRGLRGPRQVQERVWVLSPLVLPFKHHHPWVRAFNQGLLSWTLARFCKQHGFTTPMVWTYHPFVLESLQRLRQRHSLLLGPTVYHCVDDLASIPGIDAAAFNTEEQRLLPHCQLVFTSSISLAEKCSAHHSHVHNFPNVVDVEHFSKAWRTDGPLPTDLAAIPEPRLAYVGALSDFKVDFELLDALAAANSQWNLVLIGDEREGQHNPILHRMIQRQNVYALGHRPYTLLPNYLRGMHVGLLPSLVNTYTDSMFPMKYFEYLAAGLPVISTRLKFTELESHNEFLKVVDNLDELEKAIHTQLNTKNNYEIMLNVIGSNTWDERLKKMLIIVNDLPLSAVPRL